MKNPKKRATKNTEKKSYGESLDESYKEHDFRNDKGEHFVA